MESESKTVNIELPVDSIIRRIFESTTGSPNDIKEHEETLTDAEYNEIMSKFIQECRDAQDPSKRLNKKIKLMEDARKPQYGSLKKGFLN